MTRSRYNQAKQSLSTSKAHKSFSEDNDNITQTDPFTVKNVQLPTNGKDAG